VREQTSILIALAGPSGSGKTFSGLRIARGLVGSAGTIAGIDTEAGRMLHYADRFDFQHGDMKAPFSPEAYALAIADAIETGAQAIIIDSASHEWAGDGGCQDMHDVAHLKLGGKDSTNVLAWRGPKLDHKRMVSRLLQCRAHLIFCLRAEEKIKFVKEVDAETKREVTRIVPQGWMPICEKNFMYEMTVSFMLHDDTPGVGRPMKLQEQHKPCFPAGALLDESAGERLAAWAAGGAKRKPAQMRPTDSDVRTEAQASDSEGPPEPETSGSVPAVPDEATMRAASLAAIERERAKLHPSTAGFAKVCAYYCVTDDLSRADISQLDDLLAFLRALSAGDPEVKKTLDTKILHRPAA
jgi:hypothetical protein